MPAAARPASRARLTRIWGPSFCQKCAARCCQRPRCVAERVKQLRLALRVTGLARDIAPEFSAIARPRDRERRRQDQVGIVLLLGAGVVLQVIAAIGLGLGEHRPGAEPLAEQQVQFLGLRQAAMCAVMHQDRQPELARADDGNRQHEGEGIGPRRNHRDRTQNQRPCMRDQGDALPGRPRADLDQFLLAHDVAGSHAKRGHGCFSLASDEPPGAEFAVSTESEPRGLWRRIGLRAEQAQHLGGQIIGRTAHRLAFQGDADRDGPEAPRAGLGIEPRLPAARRHLGRIGAQAFRVQPFDRSFHQRRQVLATAGQRHRLDEEADGIRAHHALDQRAGVIRWRELFARMLFGGARHVKHVTARGFDEQRFLGAKVIGDLARKGVGRGRNRGNRDGRQPLLLEQAARGIEQA